METAIQEASPHSYDEFCGDQDEIYVEIAAIHRGLDGVLSLMLADKDRDTDIDGALEAVQRMARESARLSEYLYTKFLEWNPPNWTPR
jgi:hypothetical protein